MTLRSNGDNADPAFEHAAAPSGHARPARRCWRIETAGDDLVEGLFGQLVLWIFELLPGLAARGITPQWDIRSSLYGQPPDFRIIPGLFEPVVPTPAKPHRVVSLLALRTHRVSVLGNDWPALHALWHAYFRICGAVLARADALPLPPGTLGVHYRGTDKNQALSDTNPVAVDDLLVLVDDFLEAHPDTPAIFLATDDYAVVPAARRRFAHLPVHNLGPVSFHKLPGPVPDRAERALLDCLLLSRCTHLLKCSSALSGFAKVLNPGLSAHRVSASKVFFGGIPYFPDAYIPRMAGRSRAAQAILARQFVGDWLDDAAVSTRFRETFVSRPRYSPVDVLVNIAKYRVSLALGRPRKA